MSGESGLSDEKDCLRGAVDVASRVDCPTCGPTKVESHPRRPGVQRCANCKEWLTHFGQEVDRG